MDQEANDPSRVVLCWGSTHYGQLGLGGIEDEQILTPVHLSVFNDQEIRDIACGWLHTVFVMGGGIMFSCGNNDCGQLGHEKAQRKPERIDVLETHIICQASCGLEHSVAINAMGQLFSWGGNQYGQLGRGVLEGTFSHVPRPLKGLSPIVQVSCGMTHTVALSKDGRIFTWGQNQHGQLGIGPVASSNTPVIVDTLRGLPVVHVVAGGYHTLALSMSGSLFGWGKNSFGQLGTGGDQDSPFPVQCKSLRSQSVKYISCGEEHTAILTKEGGVFTFGAGMYGQLGHNSTNNELLPRKVFELMGSVVTQIQCGRKHTVAFVVSTGRIYSFGLGGNGQLGIGSTMNQNSPSTVKGPFVPLDVDKKVNYLVNLQTPVTIKQVFGGGDHTFVIATDPELREAPVDSRRTPNVDAMLHFSTRLLEEAVKLPGAYKPPPDIVKMLENVFGSLYAWNASFLEENDGHLNCSSKNPGVCLETAIEMLSQFHNVPNKVLVNVMTSALEKHLLPSLGILPDVECLRVYLTVPFHPVFSDSANFNMIQCPFAKAVIRMEKNPARILDIWWTKLQSTQFKHLINVYKQTVLHIVNLPDSSSEMELLRRQDMILVCMQFLKKLYDVNEQKELPLVSHQLFYIPDLHEKVDIRTDYVNWRKKQARSGDSLSFCNYPFVFDGQAKTLLLQTDAFIQMQAAVDEANRRNFSSMFFSTVDTVSPCLILFIRREHIVTDTINQLNKHSIMDFKKPLKVMFVGEEALDAGGVKKEFFMLLLRELQDPKYGMFQFHESSRLIWFSCNSFEEATMYSLIGALCGLAIYNATIVDLHFPLALYKKLLKKTVTLEDMREIKPTVAKGLQELLSYDGDDIEDIFSLTFEVTRESFGEVTTVPLIPNGGDIKVNKENREEYVKAYLDDFFNTSVTDPFKWFNEGFHKVCGGRVLELFQPMELQAMVVGNENYDWKELEKGAEYKGVFSATHPVIINFWEIFHKLDLSGKKRFLLFLTGSDRVPILGMKAIKLYIQSTEGGDDFLPVAHTCFNLLDLPRYSNKEVMKKKLLQAIENAEGFGLI